MAQLTAKEAAERLGLHPSRVRVFCRTGRIRGATKKGRDWLMSEAAVDAFAEKERRIGRPRSPSDET